MPVFIYTIFLCIYLVYSQGTSYYAPYQNVDDCTKLSSDQYHQFFDTATLQCLNCPQTSVQQTVSSDGYNCVCQAGYNYTMYFGGVRSTCVACGAGQTCTGALPTEPVCLVAPCQCPPNNLVGGLCLSSDCVVASPSFTIEMEGSAAVESKYFKEYLAAAHTMCKCYGNNTACQNLANMCVLANYEITVSQGHPCSLFRREDCPCRPATDIQPTESELAAIMPKIFFDDDADRIVNDINILTAYTFNPASVMKFKAAKYSLDGKFLGMLDITNGLLQLCPDTEERLDAAYLFGTKYTQSCSISAINLWDKEKYPLVFYDLYLEFTGLDGVQQLHYIPTVVQGLKENGRYVNTEGMNSWVVTNRLFVVDNLATIPQEGAGATSTNTKAQTVRYLSSVSLALQLQYLTTSGHIYTPLFRIKYGEVDLVDAEQGVKVAASFNVDYSMSQSKYTRDFQIAIGTLSTLAVIYAGYRSYVWSRRAGRNAIDFPCIINFFFYICGAVGNIFFVVTFGIAFYFMVFFKGQDTVYLVHPLGMALFDIKALIGAGFAMKCLHVLHLIIVQVTADIFLIDWEKPRGVISPSSLEGKKGQDAPVSIWRTYFVANEWNEIQTMRKINPIFQIFAVIFFLNVVGFENVVTIDPDGSVNKAAGSYRAEESFLFRYAIAISVYVLVAVVQWLFFTLVYERFIEDKIGQFVDLCSMSNLSVFIMLHAQYGFYIHGRSAQGNTDTGMREMSEKMKKEEDGNIGTRGLESMSDQQTFVMSLPKKLRHKYEIIYQPVHLDAAQNNAARMEEGRNLSGKLTEKTIDAYRTANRFFQAFVDHSYKDIDYVIKDRNFLEGILDTEFFDPTEQKGIFYKDNGYGFGECLFYGNEMILIIFDIMFFCTVDLLAADFVLAGCLTFLMGELLCHIRNVRGRKNLATKTLVDERFLI